MPGSGESYEEEEGEPQPESRESQQIPQVQYCDTQIRRRMMFFHLLSNISFYSPRQYYLLSQMGAPDIPSEPRETENDHLKRELEVLKPELQLIKSEVSSVVDDDALLMSSLTHHLRCENVPVFLCASGTEVRD